MNDLKLELSDNAFKRLQTLVRQNTAIELPESKRHLVYSRYLKRLRALRMTSFEQYCDLVDSGDERELPEFTSAITTNYSGFFRESHHFDFLRDFLRNTAGERSLKIWSAGCATGEEPYSIAMTCLNELGDCARGKVQILATDIDVNALASARAGIYPAERIDAIDESQKKRFFRRGKRTYEGYVRIAPSVQELVNFQPLNLMAPWPMRGPIDIIFCRNVVIYFNNESKTALFQRFAQLQEPGAPIVIGHSENLMNLSDLYQSVGQTIYQRLDGS